MKTRHFIICSIYKCNIVNSVKLFIICYYFSHSLPIDHAKYVHLYAIFVGLIFFAPTPDTLPQKFYSYPHIRPNYSGHLALLSRLTNFPIEITTTKFLSVINLLYLSIRYTDTIWVQYIPIRG